MTHRILVVTSMIAALFGYSAGAAELSGAVKVDLPEGAGINSPVSMVITYDPDATGADSIASTIHAHGGSAKVYTQFPVVAAYGKASAIAALSSMNGIQSIEEDAPIEMLLNAGPHAIGADAVRATPPLGLGYNGSGVTVGIIDSGADATHPDLLNRLHRNVKVAFTSTCDGDPDADIPCAGQTFPEPIDFTGKNADTTSGHGSHVGGIVAGEGTSSGGLYRGVAPGARIDSVGVGDYASITWALDGFEFLLKHATQDNIVVINNSWGSVRAGATTDSQAPTATNAIRRVVEIAIGRGIAVVFAAGNDGCEGSNSRINPYALIPGVISAAATLRDGTAVASFSSCGRTANTDHDPTIAAPGDSIVSINGGPALYTDPLRQYQGQSYSVASGTSMATPHVSGAIALIQSARIANGLPKLSPAALKSLLVGTATNLGQASRYQGAGLIDVAKAVAQTLGVAEPSIPTSCPIVQDLSGDATQALVNTPTSSVKSLDVLSASLSSGGGNLVGTIKVDDLDLNEIGSLAGVWFDFWFSLNGAAPADTATYYLFAERLKTGDTRFGLGRFAGGRSVWQLGTGTFDTTADTIMISVPLAGGSGANTYDLNVKTLADLSVTARRSARNVIPDADSAFGTGAWAVGSTTC